MGAATAGTTLCPTQMLETGYLEEHHTPELKPANETKEKRSKFRKADKMLLNPPGVGWTKQ